MKCVRQAAHPRREGERGAAAVEFALVIWPVLLLIFGTMEIALLMRDYVGVSNAVRDSSRVASAAPRQGNVAGHAGDSSPSAVPSFAYDASQVLAATGTALNEEDILDMWVYLANSKGFPAQSVSGWQADTTEGFDGGCPAETCVRYAWEDDPDGAGPLEGSFGYRGGSWDPEQINSCPNDANAMAVGVYMRVKHKGLVDFLGIEPLVSDHAVVKFEPLRLGSGSCKP